MTAAIIKSDGEMKSIVNEAVMNIREFLSDKENFNEKLPDQD